MRVPSEDELAAIAAAYVAVAARRADSAAPSPPRASRWALAGRLPLEYDTARVVTSRGNRWNVAGRLSE
jgi:hypothetical protein